MGCTYERKRLAGTDCVGCTYDRKQFPCIIVFFSSIVRISVFERSPVAHDLILPNVCARRAYPRRFLGRVGRTPLSPTLTWRRFQMPSRKGVKNRLYSTDAHQCRYYKHGSHDPTFRAYKSKHMRKLNMSEYRHLQMKKAEKPDYLQDPPKGTRS